MTRLNTSFTSRSVRCPVCDAKKGERCWSPFSVLRSSHRERIEKARTVFAKRDRAKRLSPEATQAARMYRADLVGRRAVYGSPERNFGHEAAKHAAIAAVDKLIRTRGAR